MQPKTVLHDYLSDLLGKPESENSAAEQTSRRTDSSQPPTRVAICRDQPRVSQNSVSARADSAAEVAAGECPAVGFSAEKKRLPVAVAPGLPEWALAPFQILLFRIRGVDLAVRLKELDSILRWNGESTAIPGQPGWQRGLFLHQRGVVSLVDLSGLIMPERSMPDADALPAYLLLVGGARRAVLCDSIQRPRLVCADDVRWHLSREKRPWSYGIMAENLAMLLDVNALMRMLGTNCA